MKKLTFLLCLTLFITLTINGQESKTYSGQGKVILNDGTITEGFVEYCLSFPGKVHIKISEDKKEKYNPKEIKEFFIGDRHYMTVKAKGAVNIGSDLSFSMILTPADWKIKVYKYEQQPIVGTPNFPITTEYYVSVPGLEGAIPVTDLKFNPSKKISKYIEDCPALVTKISNKEKEVTYGMITSDEIRINVLMKIAEEYQNCK